ncbi:MAG: glycosyltransferase family 2 protein [Phycicoccus sp.]|nr:glycosyltransferase family 2 protein [Phycicoccus sp.]
MKKRILFCITVYNGRAFVPLTLESAARLESPSVDLDVLILDDCSPDPGWSEELRSLCEGYGFRYYRSPRNLGIPRNVNLGLRAALRGDYDFVVISNSDVLYPSNLLDEFLTVGETKDVGSVTAWSNNVSMYSIPNAFPDSFLADQGVVDWVSATVGGNFSGTLMDVPAGISFCILIPTAALRQVGLMDPVFGRGYCEETDWSLRSKILGYRITVAPGVFVYHAGGGSNRDAGLIVGDATTVPANEAIIDLRYPQFRDQVAAFASSGILGKAHIDATRRIITDGGRQFGYSVEVGWLPRKSMGSSVVRCVVAPDQSRSVHAEFLGFSYEVKIGADDDVVQVLRAMFEREPDEVNLYDRGAVTARFQAESGLAADRFFYPTRV